MSESPFLDAALAAANAEFRVFPVAPASKVPAIKDWKATATCDPKTVQRLWRRHPDANIGVATGGELGLFVLDVDGDEGRRSRKALETLHGRLPRTVEVRTPRGRHYYFRGDEPVRNSVAKLGPGLDVRGEGGYVVGAGSINDRGETYRYAKGRSPGEIEIAEIPPWLLTMLIDPRGATQSPSLGHQDVPTSYAAAALKGETDAVAAAPEGSRNHMLNKAAFSMGQLVRQGLIERAKVEGALTSAARAAGLEPDEISATIESGLAAGLTNPRRREFQQNSKSRGRLVRELAKLGETDTDNARRLVERYQDQLQFIPESKEWFAFDGQIWREDRAKKRIIFAQQSARLIAEEAEFVEAEQRSDRRSWAERSLAAAGVRRTLEMAQPHATRSIKDLDCDPWLLNVKNGTLNLRTGALGPFRPTDHLTRMAGTCYDADAKCPQFAKFLRQILGEDRELIRFVQRYAGYSLTGSTVEQVFLFCQGPGGNGKSTLITIMQETLGDYALSTPTETFLAKLTASSSSNDVARLHRARMVAAVEANPNRQLDEAFIKQVTGGDRIAARFLYAEHFEFTPEFKLWFVANHPPRLRSTDDALWRRIRVVPFNVSIAPGQVDPDLVSKLRSELPGVLAWAVRGCKSWQKTGLNPPERVLEATRCYRKEVDHVRRFLQECVVPNDNDQTRSSILYDRYERWCTDKGEHGVSMKKLASRLTEAGYVPTRQAGGTRAWRGLSLRE